jgi:hypothetical protein
MVRKVLLPRKLEEILDNFTGLTEEVDGILLYPKFDTFSLF